MLPSYLSEAERIFEQAGERFKTLEIRDPVMNPDYETLRWFPLPGEVLALLRGEIEEYPRQTPIRLP